MCQNRIFHFNFFLVSLLVLCFQKPFFAEEKSKWGDASIVFAFKTLAKSYIATTDINKLKKNGIDKLVKMNEAKFRERYLEVYPSIKELPGNIKMKYGLVEKMTKKQAIKSIARLDKKQVYEIIDAVPNSVIAGEFRRTIAGDKQSNPNGSLTAQVSKLWKKVTANLEEK